MQQMPLTNVSLSSLVNQRRRQEMTPVEEPGNPCHDESCCDGMVDNVMAAATTARLERHVHHHDAATIQIITSNHKTTGRNQNLMALSFLQQQQNSKAPPRPCQPDEHCASSSSLQEEAEAQTCFIKTTLDHEDDSASNDDNDHEKADKIRHCSTLATDETHCPASSFVTKTPRCSLPHTLQRNVQEAFAGSNKLKTRHALCSRVQRIRSCRLAAATKSKQYDRSLAPLHATTTATSSDTMMMILVDVDNNNGKENQAPPSTFSR